MKYITEFTSFVANIDLEAYIQTTFQFVKSPRPHGHPTVRVVDPGGGSLSVLFGRYWDTSVDPQPIEIPCTLTSLVAGDELDDVFMILASGTTVAKVRATWD